MRLKVRAYWNGGWPFITVSGFDRATRRQLWMRELWFRLWPLLLVLTASDKRRGFRNRFIGFGAEQLGLNRGGSAAHNKA